MQNNDSLNDIWELYGVRENPFSTSPILVVGGSIPIDSFVGRSEHIKRLSKIIGSKGGSRTFIYGDMGVGKTSFVNVVRHSAYEQGFFTPFKEITTQDSWEAEDFILNTLSSIYATLKLLKNRPLSEELYQKIESLFEVGRNNITTGISIAGFGGNYGSERTTERLPSSSLHQFFSDIIGDISKNTEKEVIIHYNNLELISEKKLRKLFDSLRDFFQTKNVHFIFIGNLSAYSIMQSIPRFSSILTDTPFHIEVLKINEVKEIMKKRFEHLRISQDYNLIYPYNEDSLHILYDLFNGNIRDILNSLSTAIFYATLERPIVLDRNKLAKTLKEILEKRYLNSLTPKIREVLNEMVNHEEITNKALSDKLKIPRSNISIYIKDLENSGCVYLRRKNGKDKFWKVDPKIKWLLLKESSQQVLSTSVF
ncbi:AAA family ATPase [Candidatus Woesearchaeota archaeon]|nr:AAA family ATPase [Candidatus Woesearchaeota archaeon]